MSKTRKIYLGFFSYLCLVIGILISLHNATLDPGDYQVEHETFYVQFDKFVHGVEAMLVWRNKSIEFYKKIAVQDVLSAKDLRIIQNEGTERYLAHRDILLNIINDYRHISDPNTAIEITTKSPTGKLIKKDGFITDELKLNYIVNPSDDRGIEYIKRAKMAFAASLVLYDNYVMSVMHVQENKKVRHIINLYLEGDENFLLEKVSENFGSIDNFKRINKMIPYALEIMDWENKHPDSRLMQDIENQYLNHLISQSYAFTKIPQLNLMDIAKWNLGRIMQDINDEMKGIFSFVMNQLSSSFGNTVGLYEARKGKLFNMPIEERKDIVKSLRPLDILLEKTPFRLTDKFIPGHWGHVAIWMGTELELKELGIWDALPQDYRMAIQKGHSILEALRPGVKLSSFDHFLNIDDLAVLRVEDGHLDDDKLRRYLLNGFEQVNKEYDFNFDVETLDKIVCSETVYVTYDDEYWRWPTSTTLGRVTISPDNVAEKVKGVLNKENTNDEEQILEPVILYHDGLPVNNNVEQVFNHLMNQRYDVARNLITEKCCNVE